MPIVDLDPIAVNQPIDTPSGFAVTPGADDLNHGSETPDWTWSDVAGAAFRQDNIVGAALSSRTRGMPLEQEPGFSPWDAIKGTKYEPHWKSFIDVRNSRAAEVMKSQIDREEADHRMLSAAPWWASTPAQIAAGALDLPTLLPGGAFVRGAKGGIAIARSAAVVGAAAGAGAALQETGLHGLEETRTFADSGMNIAGAVLLGGLLGAGGAAMLSRSELRRAETLLTRDVERGGTPAGAAKSVYDDVFKQLRDAGVEADEARTNAAIYAARYATRAERLGADADELYRSEGLTIRPGGEAGEGRVYLQTGRAPENRAVNVHVLDLTPALRDVATEKGFPLFQGESERPITARLTGKELGDTRSIGDLREAAYRHYENQFVKTDLKVTNEATGHEISFSPLGLRKATRTGSDLLQLIPAIPDMLRKGRLIDSRADEAARSSVKAFHRFAARVDLGGRPLDVVLVVRETKDGSFHYSLHHDQGRAGGQPVSSRPKGDETLDQGQVPPALEGAPDELNIEARPAEGNGPRGRITFGENGKVIDLFAKADRSTFMHESGHLWLDELARDAARTDAPQGLKDDFGAVLKWLGVDRAEDIGVAQHEKWARGFERYLAEGKAPSSALEAAFEKFKAWLAAIYRALSDLGEPIPEEIRGVMDRMLATDSEIAAARSPLGQAAVGAQVRLPTSLEDNSIAGRAASAVAARTRRLNPALRLNQSPSAVVREIAGKLFENAVYLKKNFAGQASEPAVETLMKEWNGGLVQALRMTRDAFSEYRKAGGPLDRNAFYEAVGRAMRRGDTAPDQRIAKVAQEWRAKVFDPLKQAAIAARMLPPDVSVDTAVSYFSRVWNRNKLIAREGEFKAIVMRWVADNLPAWAGAYDRGVESRLAPIRLEIEDLEMAKLRRAEEARRREEGGEITAGDFSESDIRQALRIVRGGAPKPKGVKTLSQFVAEAGGLVDYGGELAARGITNRTRPGFVRKERKRAQNPNGGWALDDMARHAWEHGYFPESLERPSIDQFVEALADDFHKVRRVLRQGDRDAYRMVEMVDQLEHDLARIGVEATAPPRFATSEEMKDIVARVYQALDVEADRKIADLRKILLERETEARLERDSRFLGDPVEAGRSIADEVFQTLTGKTTDDIRPEFLKVSVRGPLRDRSFHIPDELVEDFLESDIEHVGRRYVRMMGADIELSRKFYDVNMSEAWSQLRDDYKRLRAQLGGDERARLAIDKSETSDIEDLKALRDLLRGQSIYRWDVERNYGRIVRVANYVNYIRTMGEVVLASINDAVRPAMVHGLGRFMATVPQLVGSLDAVKMSVAEAQMAGNVAERVLAHRLAMISDIADPYSPKGPIEAFLANMTNVASKWNGIRMWTDMMKSIASVMTQNRILEGIAGFAELGAKERAYLAYLGIDQSMAGRIATQFTAHGKTVDGVRVAGTEAWTDAWARRVYRAAMNKDVDTIVVQGSVADLPLFAHTPTGKMMLQFKTFALASHQRILLRGLQEDQARFIGGTVAMTAMGMLITYLKAISGNRPEVRTRALNNPGWWIGEGFDRAGVVAVPMELANIAEKATGFNPLKSPLRAIDQADGMSQKLQNRSLVGTLAGPTAGMIDDIATVSGIPQTKLAGKDVTKGQVNAAERLLPFNSYAGLRQILRYVVNVPE